MPPDADRLAPLRRVKLRALVRDNLLTGDLPTDLVDGGLPGGATLLSPGPPAAGWVLIDDGSVAGFGAALAWARRVSVASLDVLVSGTAPDSAPGVVARRASAFRSPPAVWRVSGRDLVAAVPAPAPVTAEPDGDLAELASVIASHGADPVYDHGVLRGEVLGLEVARAVRAGVADGGGWRLDVGVGRHDREARVELRPDQTVGDALDDVVAVVRRWRVPGGQRHPATMLARSGWLRAVVMGRPSLAGALSLVPVGAPLPSGDLRRPVASTAVGVGASGTPLVVVCSTGVDVDLIPTAADARIIHSPKAALIVVVPEGDDYPLTRDLASSLAAPASVRTVPRDWTSLAIS